MPDDLEVKFMRTEFFVNTKTKEMIGFNYTISKEVPPQLYNDWDYEKFLPAFNGVLHTLMVSSIVLAPILQYLWGFINSLQLIVHLPVLSFRYPACVFWSLRLFRDFTNFNVMSLD